MVDISGIGDKLVSNVDNIAGCLVFLADDGINSTINMIDKGMNGQLHMPPLKETFQDVIFDPNFLSLATMAIGTHILGQAGVPYMGKVGGAITKATIGYAVGKGISRIIYRTANAGGGSYAPGGSLNLSNSGGARSAMQTPQGSSYVYNPVKVVDPNISPDVDVFS